MLCWTHHPGDLLLVLQAVRTHVFISETSSITHTHNDCSSIHPNIYLIHTCLKMILCVYQMGLCVIEKLHHKLLEFNVLDQNFINRHEHLEIELQLFVSMKKEL